MSLLLVDQDYNYGEFLYREFCNHVYLGQWEFSRACALSIYKSSQIGSIYKQKLKETLKLISENPHLIKKAWLKFPTPSYVSFLSSSLLLKISGLEDHHVGEYLHSIAEFNVRLEESFPKLSESQMQELASFHKALLDNNYDDKADCVLSEDILKHICANLYIDPYNVLSLLNQLHFPKVENGFKGSQLKIAAIVFDCLYHLLKQTESSNMKGDTEKYNKMMFKCCTILRLLPDYLLVCQDLSYELRRQLDDIMELIMQLCNSHVLEHSLVYACLISRTSCQFLDIYCKKEDEGYSLHQPTKIPVFLTDSVFKIEEAALWSLKANCHFLEYILIFAVQEVLSGNYFTVSDLLSKSLLSRLLPLVLILAWGACKDDSDFSNIMIATKSWQPGEKDDPSLVKTLNGFLTNVSFKEGCVEYYSKHFPEADSYEIVAKAQTIFKQLQTHSPLQVLQTVFGLKNLDPELVFSLLDCCFQGSPESDIPVQTNSMSLAAMRDSVIFHAYLAITYVMEAILFSNEISQLVARSSADGILKFVHNKVNMSVSNVATPYLQIETRLGQLKDYLQHHGFEAACEKYITGTLKKAEYEIKWLYPITFRVEILENIFSLLFLSSKDFYESFSNSADSDEGHEGEEKYSNSSLRDYESKNTSTTGSEPVSKLDAFLKESVALNGKKVEEELLEAQRSKPPRSESLEHNSGSAGSSGSSHISGDGFLCNELVVNDLLLLLNNAILEADVESFKARKDYVANLNNESGGHKKSAYKQTADPLSSVKVEEVQKRTTALLQFVKEALWRYRLVESSVQLDQSQSSEQPEQPNLAGASSITRKQRPSEKSKSTAFSDTLCSSALSGTDNAEGYDNSLQRRKKKKRRKGLSKTSTSWDPNMVSAGIVHCMLSSPNALLRRCLWQQNEEKAWEVIELYGLHQSLEAQELQFLKQVNQLCDKMKKMHKTKDKSDASFSQHTKSSMPDIAAIAKAAASGLSLTMSSSVIDQAVRSWKIPAIPEISECMKIMAPAEKSLISGIDNLSSIALADVAFAQKLNLNQSITLLEMSLQQWRESSPNSKGPPWKKNFSFIPDTPKIIHSFLDLSKKFELFFVDSLKFSRLFFPYILDHFSFSQCLVSYIGPLDNLTFSNQLEIWKLFTARVNDFKELLDCEVGKDARLESVDQCHNPSNKLHVAFKDLIQVVKDLSRFSSEVIRPHPVKYKSYLKKLYVYLQQVTGALLGCKDHNISIGLPAYTSYFSALKESPTDIIRKIIDQKSLSQQKIENFALGMKVDLGHVLLESYFPKIPLLRERMFEKFQLLKVEPDTFLGYPSLVLNGLSEAWSEVRHPDLVARELLKDFISMAQDVAMARDCGSILTPEALLSLSCHSELESWMQNCSEIAYVDLDLLKSDEELRAFFINVTNIAWMHALLLGVLVLNEEQNDSGHSSSNKESTAFHLPPIASPHQIQRIMQQKTMGYCIGQLGFVSLFDLRYNILHSSFPIPKHLESAPYNQLFYNFNSLPPIWAKYMPKANPYQLFVLCEGMLYSPKLQVMYSDMIFDQLEEAMRDYMNYSVVVDANDKLVQLPQLLDFYSQDFDSGKDPRNLPYEGLLNFFVDLLHPSLAKPLEELLGMNVILISGDTSDYETKKAFPFTIRIKKLLQKPGFRLDYEDVEDIFEVPSACSHPDDNMLNYLNNRCPILSQLYSLMNGSDLDSRHDSLPIIRFLEQSWSLTSNCTKEELKPSPQFSWFISALSPEPLTDFTYQEIQHFLNEKSWMTMLKHIDLFIEAKDKVVDPSFLVLRHILLQILAGVDCVNGVRSWTWALCISDPVSRAQTVLLHVDKWPKDAAVNCIEYCLCESLVQENTELCCKLQSRLKEIEMYQKILDLSLGDDQQEVTFTKWQDVEEKSVWDQRSILNCIKRSGDYKLAVQWSSIHAVDSPLKLMGYTMKVVWYLNQTPPELGEVSKIMASCDINENMELVEASLLEISSIESKLQLVQFLISQGLLQYEEQCHYLNMILGLKMLRTAYSSMPEQYSYLVAYPHLLLEQMLMNMEIEEAEKSLEAISDDLKSEESVSLSPLFINSLLETYAAKAIEIPLLDDLTDSFATIVDSDEVTSSAEHFVMPPTIPTREQWVPDSRVRVCQCCNQEQFNMFSRRHHCRRCGRVICADCSQSTLVLEGYGKHGVKVCDDCFKQTTSTIISGGSSSFHRSSSFDKRYQMLSSMVSSGVRSSPFLSEFVYVKRTNSMTTTSTAFCWALTTNDEQDAIIRKDFFYDSAPSMSLCLAILKLHSNTEQCTKFMLGLCDYLINKMRPRSSGKQNSEVDYYLVLSMIRTFLMNAQVKYHQLLDPKGEALVDTYFERLEIIKMLVNANCAHLIPKEDYLDNEIIRKLCDKVLKEERMALALEISTNRGLDKSGVWSTWGFFCLRAGDWLAAREKFKQILKVPKNRRIKTEESPALSSIISFLEECKYPGHGKAAAIQRTLMLRDQILVGHAKVFSSTEASKCEILDECMFYLDTYGTHFSAIAFLQRQGLVSEAFSYILKEKCDPEVFVEAMFMPMLRNSQLTVLLQHLSTVDNNLVKSWPYLLSVCRYLQRIGYLSVLYKMQVFMQDYIRAAKSSITFYLAPAENHRKVYFERSHYLHNAKKHFETYLANIQSVTSYMNQNKNVMTLSESEVRSYIRTIKLQEELTEYIKTCDKQKLPIFEFGSSVSNEEQNSLPGNVQLLTLFGNPTKKSQIASMVLVNAIKVDEGFDFAVRLVKEYHLSPMSVVCSAAREVVRLQWLDLIEHFIQNIQCCFQDAVKIDDVILECIECIVKEGGDADFLIKKLSSDAEKFNAFLLSKKLKNAYLLAIKLKRPQNIRRVMKAAEQTGQDAVRKFCERWLAENDQKSSTSLKK